MKLDIIIDDKTIPVELSAELIASAEPLLRNMDKDMDKGWQMSRVWVDNPNQTQRCQIVADKLLVAIEQENKAGVGIYSSYILNRLEGVSAVDIDTSGEISATEFRY